MKLGLCAAIFFVAGCLAAADAPVTNTPPHTNAPVSLPPEQLEIAKTFQLKRGFRLELVAGENLVTNPVAMAFDENGRMFVLEAGGSSDLQPGRVRLLEDSDTNGVFDSSTVYADNVSSPSALICYGGGVFVGAGGQIIYLKDTNSDGHADARREVFKSFGEPTNGNGGKVTITSLAWGLDNRIHAATAGLGGDVISSSSPVQSIVLTNGNFAFDPRLFVLTSESGSGPSGMAFDNSGHKFVSSPTRHLQAVMYDAAGAARNPLAEMPPLLLDLAPGGPASLIYPAKKSTSASYDVAPDQFSAASGLMIYRGSAFPPEYVGDAFVMDAVANVVHRDKLRPNGIEWVAERPADEQGMEFLAVKDDLFQLRCLASAPDGALYIAGVSRDKFAAAKAGKTNPIAGNLAAPARIYRVVPVNFKPPKAIELGKAKSEQLVLWLRHPNGWQRDTAARLLFERQDRTTVVPLIRLLFDLQAPPLARVHALRALDGLQITAEGRPGKALMEPHVERALSDPEERVREQAVLLAARFIQPGALIPERLWGQLANMAGDPSPQVRYQLAFLLGQFQQTGRVPVLAAILRTDATSRWLQAAVISSLNDGAGEMFGLLAADANFRNTDNGQEYLRRLLLIVGQKDQRAEVTGALADCRSIPEPQLAFDLALALGNGVQRANDSLTAIDRGGLLDPVYIRAENLVLDMNADDGVRIAALRLLSTVTNVDIRLSGGLGEEWMNLRPKLRSEAIMYLLSRVGHTSALLYGLQAGYIPKTDLTPAQIKFLFNYENADIHQSTVAVFGNDLPVSRQAVVNRFQSSLQLTGRAERGRQIYQARCAICHQLAGQGSAIGLSLESAARMSKPMLLTKILDPNREGTFSHPESTVATSDGETILGFVARENPKSTTFCDPNGVERTVGRANNVYQHSLGFSGMPVGLEAGLNQQDLADVLEFITSNAP